MKSVEGISQNKSIVKSNGRGSLKRTLARRCPTRIEGKKFLDEDLALVDRSKQEKKNPWLNLYAYLQFIHFNCSTDIISNYTFTQNEKSKV